MSNDQNQIEIETPSEEIIAIAKGRGNIKAKTPPPAFTEADVQRLAQTINKLLKDITLYRNTTKWYANGGSDTGERARQVLELVKK